MYKIKSNVNSNVWNLATIGELILVTNMLAERNGDWFRATCVYDCLGYIGDYRKDLEISEVSNIAKIAKSLSEEGRTSTAISKSDMFALVCLWGRENVGYIGGTNDDTETQLEKTNKEIKFLGQAIMLLQERGYIK